MRSLVGRATRAPPQAFQDGARGAVTCMADAHKLARLPPRSLADDHGPLRKAVTSAGFCSRQPALVRVLDGVYPAAGSSTLSIVRHGRAYRVLVATPPTC